MKKIVSITLLSFYLISTTGLVELSKLPVLFKHYHQHQLWDTETTFFGFMIEHYAESIADNPDYDLDKKLPFKSRVDHSFAFSLLAPPVAPFNYHFAVRLEAASSRQCFAFPKQRALPSYLASIWQPPKHC